MFNKFVQKNALTFYFVFRLLVGLVFLLHGIAKWNVITSMSFNLFWFAGVIEIIAGIFLILGFLVRYTALVAAVEMLVAFFTVHAAGGFNPLTNGGEAAVLFFAAFLVLIAYGGGKWSVSKK